MRGLGRQQRKVAVAVVIELIDFVVLAAAAVGRQDQGRMSPRGRWLEERKRSRARTEVCWVWL